MQVSTSSPVPVLLTCESSVNSINQEEAEPIVIQPLPQYTAEQLSTMQKEDKLFGSTG